MNANLGDNISAGVSKMGNALNQTIDNAAQNLNTILNGNQNPYLATSAGSIPMSSLNQNYNAFSNAGTKDP